MPWRIFAARPARSFWINGSPSGSRGEAAARDESESYIPVIDGPVAAQSEADVLAAAFCNSNRSTCRWALAVARRVLRVSPSSSFVWLPVDGLGHVLVRLLRAPWSIARRTLNEGRGAREATDSRAPSPDATGFVGSPFSGTQGQGTRRHQQDPGRGLAWPLLTVS